MIARRFALCGFDAKMNFPQETAMKQ